MSRIGLQIFAFILIAIGLSAFVGNDARSDNVQRSVPKSEGQLMLSYSSVVKQVSPAVVNIYTSRTVTKQYSPFAGDPFFEQFFGRNLGGLSRQQVESSLGSGVIIGADGFVITNAHVVKGADEISVFCPMGVNLRQAYLYRMMHLIWRFFGLIVMVRGCCPMRNYAPAKP